MQAANKTYTGIHIKWLFMGSIFSPVIILEEGTL